jgi:hypothetical protein
LAEEQKGRPGNDLIEGQVVRLDYGRFEKKTFYKCTLVYGGGLPPTLIDCDFIESMFAFEGAAQNTIAFMSSFVRLGGEAQALMKLMIGLNQNG